MKVNYLINSKQMKRFCFFCLVSLVLCGCEKDPSVENNTPSIASGLVTNITNTSATINIQITSYSDAACNVGVIYSTSKSFTNAKREDGEPGLCYITGLTRNTMYYYKAYATNGTDYVFGEVRTFTTLNTSATVTTVNAYSLGYNSSYSYPYRFNVAVAIVGLDQVEEWGVMVSSDKNFSYNSKSAITDFGYVEGTTYIQSWGSTITGTRYCRAYAKLLNGSYIYGITKTVILSRY